MLDLLYTICNSYYMAEAALLLFFILLALGFKD